MSIQGFSDASQDEMASAAAMCRLMEGRSLNGGLSIAVNAITAVIAAQELTQAEEKFIMRLFTTALAETLAARRKGLLQTAPIARFVS